MTASAYFPDDPSVPPSEVHRDGMNGAGRGSYLDGLTPWHAAHAPDLTCGHGLYTTTRLRSCGYCGSLHPAEVAAWLRAGASVHWADFKYGWPHKVYVDGIPNPYAGMESSHMGKSEDERGLPFGEPESEVATRWVKLQHGYLSDGRPSYSWHRRDVEPATTQGKFYTIHLKDANAEDRDTLERAIGLHMRFAKDGTVWWRPYGTPDREGSTS